MKKTLCDLAFVLLVAITAADAGRAIVECCLERSGRSLLDDDDEDRVSKVDDDEDRVSKVLPDERSTVMVAVFTTVIRIQA